MSQSSSSQRARHRAHDYDLDQLIDLSQPQSQSQSQRTPSHQRRPDTIDLTDSPRTPGHRGAHASGAAHAFVPATFLSPSTRPNTSTRPQSSSSYYQSRQAPPQRQPVTLVDDFTNAGFGSSISKPAKKTPAKPSSTPRMQHLPHDYGAYIRPATGFKTAPRKSAFDQPGYQDGWPVWAAAPASADTSPPSHAAEPKDKEEVEVNGEDFDLNQAKLTAEDFERFHGDPEEQMRELLAGAVGEGEGDDEDGAGADTVEGFADGMHPMPHQIRGVRWMRERETGRKYGGILADVSC